MGCQVLAEDLDAGLELMADVVMNPSFPEDAFLRKGIFWRMRRRIWKTLFPWRSGRERKVAYGHVSYGNSLPARRKTCLHDGSGHQKQYERIICASNAVICISGDVRKEEVLPLLEKHLGGMRAGTPRS
ncbi:MAG: hypothetical protein ACLSUW_07805 [Akkermansia sp.]